ncbi:MAG: hypothetical protein HY326_09350 [Chloroflexi bacterium]|nr:hypothetical protein [Chloroflexota bacterium]
MVVTPVTQGRPLKIDDFSLDAASRLTVSGSSTLPDGTILDVWLERGAPNEPGAQRLSGWLGSGKVAAGHFQAILNREGGDPFNAGTSYTAVVRAMLKGDLYQDAMKIPADLIQSQAGTAPQISGAVATVQPQNPQAQALLQQLKPALVAAGGVSPHGALPDSLAKNLMDLASQAAAGLLYLSPSRDAGLSGDGYLWQVRQPTNLWLVRVAGAGESYLLWQSQGGIRYQQLDEMVQDANGKRETGVLSAPPRHLLAAPGAQGTEIFIAADTMYNRAWAQAWLLRLSPEGQALQLVWHSRQAGQSWEGSDGGVNPVGDTFDRFKLVGGIPADFPDASRVFSEQDVFTKQRMESVWERVGDSYMRLTGRVLPTPLTTLSDFILAIRQKDMDRAAGLVVSPALIDLALKEGWDRPIPANRLIASGGYGDQIDQPIQFWEGGTLSDATFKYRVAFLQHGDRWLIASIEKAN